MMPYNRPKSTKSNAFAEKITNPKFLIFPILVLCYVVLCAFVSSWYFADDFYHIQDFAKSRSFDTFVVDAIQGQAYTWPNNHYRPVTNIILSALLRLGSSDAAHFVRLLFHIATGYFFFLLLGSFQQTKKYAIPGTILFLFNPVIHNNLYYISSVGDILTTLFSLMAVYFLYVYDKKGKMALVCITYIFALLSKEMCVTLPAIMAVLSLFYKRFRRDLPYIIGLFSLALIFMVIRGLLIDKALMGDHYTEMFSYGLHTFVAFGKYVYTFLFTFPRHILFQYPVFYGSGLVFLLIWLSAMRKKTYAAKTYLLLVFGFVFSLSILPVVNVLGAWYRYYPAVLFTGFLIWQIATIETRKIRMLSLWAVLVMYVGLSFQWSVAYKKSADFEKNMLHEMNSIKQDEIIIAGLPLYAYTEIFLLDPTYYEIALEVFHDSHKNIYAVAPTIIGKLNDDYSLRQSDKEPVQITLNSQQYNYIVVSEEFSKPGCKVTPSGLNKWGQFTSAEIDCQGEPIFILTIDSSQLK